jgi:hypothetical protein
MQWRARRKNDATRSLPLLAGVLLVLCVLWVALFVIRIHAHQANVDDYYYASVTRGLTRASDPLTALLHTGQNSPLVLLLALPGVRFFGVYGGIFVDLPLLLLLGAGVFVLAGRWLSPFGAAITTLAVALNTAVLSYAVMFNFALASTAAVVWCFAAYVRCERFTNWRWSLTFGIAFAALILSRSIAPAYAVPLFLVLAVDLVVGARRLGTLPGRPALGAAAIVLVLAGPWWALSGHALWHYLTFAGSQSSSGRPRAPGRRSLGASRQGPSCPAAQSALDPRGVGRGGSSRPFLERQPGDGLRPSPSRGDHRRLCGGARTNGRSRAPCVSGDPRRAALRGRGLPVHKLEELLVAWTPLPSRGPGGGGVDPNERRRADGLGGAGPLGWQRDHRHERAHHQRQWSEVVRAPWHSHRAHRRLGQHAISAQFRPFAGDWERAELVQLVPGPICGREAGIPGWL